MQGQGTRFTSIAPWMCFNDVLCVISWIKEKVSTMIELKSGERVCVVGCALRGIKGENIV